MEPQAKYFSSF